MQLPSQLGQPQAGMPMPQMGAPAPQGESPGGENPFMAMLQGLGGGEAAPQPSPMVQEKNAAIGAAQGVENAALANPQLEPGNNPGNTTNLLRASQALENYIKDSSDPQEIRMARTIITLITRLIESDQKRMSQDL